MKEAKHTSAPWEAVYRDEHEWAVNAPKGDKTLGHSKWNALAVVYGCDDMPIEGAAVAKANACLIAAAPDLLTALQSLLQRYTSLVNSGDAGSWDPETESEVIAARRALSAASPSNTEAPRP